MANKLDITGLFTDNSAQVINYKADPKGTGDTDYELTLMWSELDVNQTKTILETYKSTSEVTNVKADGISWGSGWYIAYQPVVSVNNEKVAMAVVTLTKEETKVGKSFEYEDRSISAYTAIKTRTYTATREKFRNAVTAPTLTEDYGTLDYSKNVFDRFDGEKIVKTYDGSWTADPMEEGDIEFYQLWFAPLQTKGKSNNVNVLWRKGRRVDSSQDECEKWADNSSLDPVGPDVDEQDGVHYGSTEYNPRYNLYIGWKVQYREYSKFTDPDKPMSVAPTPDWDDGDVDD